MYEATNVNICSYTSIGKYTNSSSHSESLLPDRGQPADSPVPSYIVTGG